MLVVYWNKCYVELMFGSIIYVGFVDFVWSEMFDVFNVDIF